MKRIIPAVIILFIVIFSYFGSYIYINYVCNAVEDQIEDCLNEYKKEGIAKNSTKKLNDYWDKKEKLLSIFVNHELIDKIEVSISNMNLHSNFEENTMFYESCDTVKMLLHQVKEDTRISAHSVF